MNPQEQQKLERLVNNALRDLPARRAPSSLELRVKAEISRRAALPWWRKSFAYWPAPARGAFVTVSIAVVALAFFGLSKLSGSGALQPVQSRIATDLHWVQVARALLDTATHAAEAIIGSISPLWLYGGAAVVVCLYLALFGLGAAAYRTLYSAR